MFVIILNTIKEFIRNKILYTIVFISIWLIFLSLILSSLALSESNKIVIDFSLSIIEIFWLLTTLFLWSYLLYNEISKHTVLLVLSKNPSRKDFILWKYFGFAFVLILLYIIFTLAFLVVLWIHWIAFDVNYLFAIFLSYIKILVVLGFIIFFATFVSPFVNLLVTLCVYIISHSFSFVKFYVIDLKKVDINNDFFAMLINIMYYVFPNFQDLSMKEYLLSPNIWEYTLNHILLSTFGNLFYIAILLFFAIMIFNKKEF